MSLFQGLRKQSQWSLQRALTNSHTTDVFESSDSLFIDKNNELPTTFNSSISSINLLWNKIDLTSYFNRIGISSDGSNIGGSGLDSSGNYFSGNLLGISQFYGKIEFFIGTSDGNNVVSFANQTITLSNNKCDYLHLAAIAVNGNQSCSIRLNYSDSTTQTITQIISDWATPEINDNILCQMSYRNTSSGGREEIPAFVYVCPFSVDRSKTLSSVTLLSSSDCFILGITQVSRVTDLVCWLKADYITNKSDGNSLSKWLNCADSSRIASVITESQPTYKTNIQNGYPIVRFSGNSSFKVITNTSISNYSVFTIFKSSVTHQLLVAFSWGTGVPGTIWQGYSSNDSNPLIVASDSFIDISSLTSAADENWHMCEIIHTPGVITAYQNGTLQGSNNSTHNRPSNVVYIGSYAGSNYFWTGDIAEVLIFKTNLSDINRQVVEQYLEGKYVFTESSGDQYLLETEEDDFYIGYEYVEIETEDEDFYLVTEDEDYILCYADAAIETEPVS